MSLQLKSGLYKVTEMQRNKFGAKKKKQKQSKVSRRHALCQAKFVSYRPLLDCFKPRMTDVKGHPFKHWFTVFIRHILAQVSGYGWLFLPHQIISNVWFHPFLSKNTRSFVEQMFGEQQ